MLFGLDRVERWLDAERDQLPLWLPVMLGVGVALWFSLPDSRGWEATILLGGALMLAGFALGAERRIGRALLLGGLAMALGCALAWWRAERVAAPVLPRPIVTDVAGRIRSVDVQAAKGNVRLVLETGGASGLPPLVRVTVDDADAVPGLVPGAVARMRARLVPPPTAAVPGGYDFARAAWFQGLGAVGSAMGPVVVTQASRETQGGLRARMTAHIRNRIEGSGGGIAASFATGDRGGISAEDEEAMRASGLTHLLSVSGLHITAVVAAAMFLTMRLLALSPALALRWRLPLVAAGAGALAGIGYTLLTGAEVPTIRSCIAAVLVLIGLALGREAMTLRLVATGALIVLLLWPEALVGASFQLSFAAITAIVALHETGWVQRLVMRRDEALAMRLGRGLIGLILTGIAVEVALAPIALFHFHKQGLYGALANLVAIPLTTFVIMPLEAAALVFDTVGLGGPFWWLTGQALAFLLWLARAVAAVPGSVAMLPALPVGAFALMIGGSLWLLLWTTRARLLGFAPFITGAVWALTLPVPDMLVTGDGTHMAVRGGDGRMRLLRPRTGDFMRDVLAERSGTNDPLEDLDTDPDAECGRDMCIVRMARGGRVWRIAATRSDYRLPWAEFTATCRNVDIIVSNRRLPTGCTPRWLKADRELLARTGGLAITLGASPAIETANRPGDHHPWVLADERRALRQAPDRPH